jgi:N-acetylglutamate synthase-like GNAT family acetyltransferase
MNMETRPPKPEELETMYYQRWLVLRQPLGMSLGEERDRADEEKGVDYVITLQDGKIIGSARLREIQVGVGSIAYVAVLPEFSRQGIGTKLMAYLLNLAKEKQFHTVRLRSRVTAQGFYEKLGFTAITDPFLHIGIPHVDMERFISKF